MKKKEDAPHVLVTALGLSIQNRRKELGLSQDELADRAGLHRTYLSEIERRSRNVSVKILVRIAMALEMSPAELMKRAESQLTH
jgi:transcriptional regulator with XRE-family HTH domain